MQYELIPRCQLLILNIAHIKQQINQCFWGDMVNLDHTMASGPEWSFQDQPKRKYVDFTERGMINLEYLLRVRLT